jgi:ubiquinone biosynthesis protein UbiJ
LRIVEGGSVEAGGAQPGLSMLIRPEILVALTRGEEHAMRAVSVEGNAKLAGEVLVLARHLRWDAEEALSRVIGDVAAHRLADTARAVAAWHVDAAQRLAAALTDYVTEEKRLLARRGELEALGESVARLRDALARLDKRIERLV